MAWYAPRLFAIPTGANDDPFLVGPDRPADVRSRRPYFLLPILGSGSRSLRTGVILRIRQWLAASGGPVTDVFVMSHGWHRNFFSAMAAYDRLVFRLANLVGRGAIEPPKPFRPLFIAVHWHSDPGENLWLDKEGRRNKSGFMSNVREVFRPTEPETGEPAFERDFELMFDLLSTLSAPDTDASGHEYDAQARGLAEILDKRYDLRAQPGASLDQKTTALWCCYTSAPSRRVLMTQTETPAPFLRFLQAPRKLFSFVLSAVPIATLLGLLVNLPLPGYRVAATSRDLAVQSGTLMRTGTVRDAAAQAWMATGKWSMSLPLARDLPAHAAAVPSSVWPHLGAIVTLAVGSFLLLWLVGLWRSTFAAGKPASGIPWLAVVPWLYLQVLFTLPLVALDLLGFLMSSVWMGVVLQWLRLVSDERTGLRDRPASRAPTLNLGLAFARFANLPLRMLRSAIALDSRAGSVADAVDCQLSYYDMQHRGVSTGVQLAETLAELFQTCPELREAELHLAGHSFGAVVVSNAARTLAHDADFSGALHSVLLLNGALASNWFDRETTLLRKVLGAITAIYTRYDTANGFWYPLASMGRQAAGSVGLCGDFGSEKHTMPPMLVVPPPLPPSSKTSGCRVLNIDASRLMYAGSPVLGGGHGDIDKDDVMHVLWSALNV